MEYPEHNKMKAVTPFSHKIGEFLEWLTERHVMLAHYPTKCLHLMYDGTCHEEAMENGSCPSECPECEMTELSELYPYSYNIQKLLAEFFEIDLNKIEEEKRQMLDEMRKLNEREDDGDH